MAKKNKAVSAVNAIMSVTIDETGDELLAVDTSPVPEKVEEPKVEQKVENKWTKPKEKPEKELIGYNPVNGKPVYQ